MRWRWEVAAAGSAMIGAVTERPRIPPSPPGRPGPMARRLGGATLVAQALSVFLGALVAWQLDNALGGDQGIRNLVVLGAVALLCLLAAGALRTRAGVVLGWVCQVLTLATALLLPAMVVIALLFGLLWWWSLRSGVRIDAFRAGQGG